MELVTGATGYVGGRLVDRLLDERRPVRALARDASRVEPREGLEIVEGDLGDAESVRRALDGCTAGYYLVHSMEAAAGADFAARDRRGAESFATAAHAAGFERVVYLGGIVPSDAGPEPSPASPHLASRLEVEAILLAGCPSATALRASIVVGARSSSFRMLVRRVERLRFLPMPAWRTNRTQPIAERDAVEYLARTPAVPAAAGRSLDIGGPDVLTYAGMIERIAESMGVGRVPFGLGFSLTQPASAVVSAVTEQPLELVRPLMESLRHELLPRDASDAPQMYGIRPVGFDRAVERALAEWERTEELAAR
ncbi:hypothetical protein BH20ACT19_BH20ACT19_06330 [soil metagenome]